MGSFLRIQRVLYTLFILFIGAHLEARSYSSIGLASLASQKESSTISKVQGPLIVLDAGHGGKDEGAKVRSLQEKKLTLLTTLYTKRQLEELGYRVLLTRGKDVYVSLPKRTFIANKMKCALFVSIHFNSAKNPLAEGLEVFYSSGEDLERSRSSRKLASFLLHYVIDQTGALSRGVKTGNHLHVIRETKMPAVLFEGGFMTNRAEWSKMKEKSYLEKIAKGIAQGVDRYIKS
jgi:N-acetylmuramoyl-L-alanine amidase